MRLYKGIFVALLLAALLPVLVSRYLPFCDMYGAFGVAAAFSHKGDPLRLVDSYYAFQASPSATAFYWCFLVVLGRIVPLWLANSIYIALFILILPPLALARTLRSFGRSPWLALLAFAGLYNGIVWNGFMGASATVGLSVLNLGLAHDIVQRRQLRLNIPLLVVSGLILASAHSFLAAIGLGLAGLVIGLTPAADRWGRLWATLSLCPAVVYVAQWLARHFPSGPGKAAGGGRQLLEALAGLLRHGLPSFAEAHSWFIEGLKQTRLDDWLAGVTVLTLLALLLFGIRRGSQPTEEPAPSRLARLLPWLLFLIPVALYFLFPMTIHRPIYWWALRVRMIPLAFLLAPLCIRSRARGLPPWVMAPALALSFSWSVYLAHDFRTYFNGVHMAGFDRMLDRIPPGKRVLLLLNPRDLSDHYERGAVAYVLSHYVARSGGVVFPLMHGTLRELWAVYHPFNAPSWGIATQFVWRAHAGYWDYLVIKDAVAVRTYTPADAPPGELQALGTFDLWRLYQVTRK